MVEKNIKKFKFMLDLDLRNWGLGIWLHLDGLDVYGWAFEIIFGCFWFEVLYDDMMSGGI